MNETKRSSLGNPIRLISFSFISTIFFFSISAIGQKDPNSTFCDYLQKSFSLIYSPSITTIDLAILNTVNCLLLFIFTFGISVSKLSITKNIFWVILTLLSFLNLGLIAAKYIFVNLYSNDGKDLILFSFFIYGSLWVSLSIAVVQIWAVLFWIGFDYIPLTTDLSQIESTDPSPKPTTPKVKWSRLFGLLSEDWKIISVGMIALFFNAGTSLAIPYFFGVVVDTVSKGDDLEQLTNVVIALFLIFIFGGLTGFVRSYCFTLSGYNIVKRIRVDLFRSMILQDIEFFDETKTGDLLSRLSSDTQSLQNGITVNVSMLVRNVTAVIGNVVILFSLSWKLTLVMMSIVPLVVIAAVIYGEHISRLQEDFQQKLADSSSFAQEVISQIRTVRSFAKEKFSVSIYANEIANSHKVGIKIAYLSAIFMGAVGFFPQAAIALVLYYGGMLVMRGEITGGLLTSFLLYTLSLSMSFGALSSLFGDFSQTLGSSQKIFDLIDNQIPKIPTSGGISLQVFNGKVKFRGVGFSYPGRKEASVLKGLDLELVPGKVLALVGPSGHGKSTIMSLILRFYDPIEGSIILDDRLDLKSCDLQWYRSQIGFVSQEPVLFSGTIRENIVYGWHRTDKEPTQREIFEAAKNANAHDFISRFPEGYDTVVGERGVRLSGGQKQRLALSRAFLMDPKILLLDEATSALDAESEGLVQEAIDRAMVNRTVVVIAHRLSTVRNADQIVVIEDGRVKEKGTHNSLMANENSYFKLVSKQMLK